MAQSSGANHRGLMILLFFTFFMVMGFEMIMPLIIGYYVNTMGFSATAVAFALATRQFSQQGLAMVGGTLADRVDVRTLISIGVLLRSIGFVTLAFAKDFPLLLVSMILTGLGGVLFETPYQTAIATLTTERNRSRYYSLNNTITGIASTVGPLLGTLFLYLDFRAVCFGAAFCFMITFIISRFAMPPVVRVAPSYSVRSSLRAIGKDRPFLMLTLLMIIFWLAASQINLSFPLRIQELSGSADSVGMMFAVYAAVTTVLQYPLVSFMLRKYSPRQIVVIGIFIIAVALLLLSFINTTHMFLAVVVLFTLGFLLARPNQQTMAVAMANPQAMGMYLGVNSLGFALGSGFGAIIGGVFFDLATKTGLSMIPWFLFCAIAMVSMFGFILCKKLGQSPQLPEISTT
ncbi:MAG TPA: MFS transporter [Methylomusa anaerophila]|uniref:Multidrug resistance protein MdtH n=1 Tax=Methylomusa anaerophila TaxID=1930071 RepID=A0A348AE75_9FIRM|nr:MFS transporter [Methylomusa anaerophila]BBB89373.1 multidrug resistance protein MdtH [Methylomusa anaerophila]HML90449.1 MFS transporter [Methylomusa anaerophila]